MVKLFCAIVGDAGSAFSVEVGEDKTVDDLKDAITEKNKEDPILKYVAAKNLKLFLAKKDGAWLKSKDLLRMRKGEIPNEVESRYMNEELDDPTVKISSKFPREIPDGTIHVLLVVSSEGVSGAEVWSMERNAKRPKVLVNLELDDVWKYMEMEMNALPVDHELSTILQRPLPFRLELCHSKGTESIFEPNGPLVMCEQLTVMINAFLVARDTRVDRVVSENAWQYFYDLLLSIPISLCWAHEFCVASGRNVVDETGTTTRKKRPDFILHISGLLLLRGEEKSDSTGLNVSSAELTAKMRHWNPMFYGDLPYILGYASSGAQLRLVKIDRNLRVHTICEFQSIFRQAAEVIKTFYNLTFLLYQMHLLSKRINPSPLMPFTPVTNEKRTIELMDDVIKRTIKHDSVDFERLADIYSTLRDLNDRVHERTHLQTVRKLDLKRSLLCVQLSPLGNVRPPVDIDEVRDWLKGMLTALKYWHSCNYCHGDLRWSNIVHVPVSDSGFWVLIDMDESRKPNTTTIDWNHKFQGHKLTFEHDWYQLGQLMNSLSFPLPNDLVDVQKVLLSAVDTPADDLPTLLLNQLHY